MKKFLLPLLCSFLVVSLVGCNKSAPNEAVTSDDSQSSEEEVDPRPNSLLPRNSNDPHQIELSGLSDYLDVIDTYNLEAVVNASINTSDFRIQTHTVSGLYGDDLSNEYHHFYKDEFLTASYDYWETGYEAPMVFNDAFVGGNINGRHYTRTYDTEHEMYSYSVGSTKEAGDNARSYVADYVYTLESSDSYLVTDDYIYLVSERMDEQGSRYYDIEYNETSYTYFYIELTKDLRLSATYTYMKDVSDHVLPSGEASPDGFIISESATLILVDYNALTDYSKKQEFFDSIPLGMCNGATVKFNYQQVTLSSGEITSFGSTNYSSQFVPYKRINATQNQIALSVYRLSSSSSQYVALRSIEIVVAILIYKDDNPAKIGGTTTYTKTFQGNDTFAPLVSNYDIINYEGQDFFVISMMALISLIAVYDTFSLTPEVSLLEYHN